jgi:hypothetical protein
VVAVIPFTDDVSNPVEVENVSELMFTKLVLVVEITPFTLELSINALVEVEIPSMLEVVAETVRVVVEIMPATFEVSIFVVVE